MATHKPKLAFGAERDFTKWCVEVNAKLRELVGDMPERVPLNVRREYEKDGDGFREIRFVFTSEPASDVPCHLLIPTGATKPVPVVICLQGHSTGMHISLGRPKYDGDEASIAGGRDFGIQAVKQGYAALVMEQRCFGERKDAREGGKHDCKHASMTALLLGRTMIGERVWDVSRAIDALSEFEQIDTSRIACMGNSGGGTITYYAACLEDRISVAMPSCAFCTYRDSIAEIDHCPDNYIPNARRYFEMADLAALIAPRPLIVVAGKDDKIFPIDGVREAFETVKAIYATAGAPGNCRLVVGNEGHRFYPNEAWPVFAELSGWSRQG